jgi:hypothetical protein
MNICIYAYMTRADGSEYVEEVKNDLGMYVYIYICIYMYIFMYVCICICIYKVMVVNI